jgi:hypothetical protein
LSAVQSANEDEPVTLQIVGRVVEGESMVELHGWLSGPEIDEFKSECALHRPPLRIELKNLHGASSDGISALKEQRARGARLTGASPYIELLLASAPAKEPDQAGREPGNGA